MENKNLQNFFVFLKEHENVLEELKQEIGTLKGAEGKIISAKFVEFGKKHGFEFTVEDLQSSKDDLSDEELGQINGGKSGKLCEFVSKNLCPITTVATVVM